MALVATGLVKHFGGVKAVNGFDIGVERGEIVGLIGPNGAGKTTSFNLVTGRIIANSGSVLLDDHDVTRLRPWDRARLGLARTFQHTSLFPELTLEDNLEVAYAALGRPRRTRAARTEELAEVLLLSGADRKEQVRNLSYGFQRRVSIAIALAGEPKYVLLDEPAAGLNPDESAQLSTAVRKLAALDIGVILVEHDLELVGTTTDRVVVLAAGATIFTGRFGEALRDEKVLDSYLGRKYRNA